MPLAREGIREMVIATVVLGTAAVGLGYIHWAVALPPVIVWIWAISFFRDPKRETTLPVSEFCSPADGTVTEITHLEHDGDIGGPALKIGIFLSIFNVHANRAPCDGKVIDKRYKPGKYLDARHPDSGRLNESTTLVLAADEPYAGPVVVRQVAGMIARRIICHAKEGDPLRRGERYGMIKFGSRTELLVPDGPGVIAAVEIGQRVHAGLTPVVRMRVDQGNQETETHSSDRYANA